MTRRLCPALLPLLMVGGCAIPNSIETLGDGSPPPEFGRPGWVRTAAGLGGWVGGITGGVVSIVFLPITYPMSLLADDGLGEHASDEFMLFPAVTMAAFGHALLGGSTDAVDWVFRRAWVDGVDPVTEYDFIPLEGAEVPEVGPRLGDESGAGGDGDAPR